MKYSALMRGLIEQAIAGAKAQVRALERLLEPEPGDAVELLSPDGAWLPATFVRWVADGLAFQARLADGRFLTCGRNNYRLPPPGKEPPP